MTGRVQTLRSTVAGNRPTGRQPGELYVNWADNQLGVINASSVAQDLLAIPFFSALSSYAIGAFVVYNGQLYRALAPSSPGAFVPANWAISGPIASTTLPLMDGVAAIGNGAMWARNDHVHPTDTSLYPASNPAGYQTAAQVAAGYLPLSGGTLTGGLTAPALSVSSAANSAQLVLNAPAGQARNLLGLTGANLRWALQLGNGDAESGAAAGSNFAIARYNDAGAQLGVSFIINRATGAVTLNTPGNNFQVMGGTQPNVTFLDAGSVNRGSVYWQQSSGSIGLSLASPAVTASLNTSGQFQTQTFYNMTATAYMAGNTLWTNTSDERIKDVVGDYTGGLDEVLQLHPVVFNYLGNDTQTDQLEQPPFDPDGNYDEPRPSSVLTTPYPASMHYQLAVNQTPQVGFIAQELEQVFPDMVTQRTGYIDGEQVTDLRDVNLSNLIYALVNAIKTLAARVEDLEAMVIPR